MKQLIGVLRCNLQVMIHQGLMEAQADILEAIAGFIDNFHIEVTTLPAPQVPCWTTCIHTRQGARPSRLQSNEELQL